MLVDDGVLRVEGRRLHARAGARRAHPSCEPPRAPRRATRPTRARGSRRARARGGRGRGLPPQRGRRADARRVARRRPREPRGTDGEGSRPAGGSELRRRGCLPFQAHPRQGRDVPRDGEAAPGHAARAVRRLAGAPGRGTDPRVRGDPRVPPRAELPLPRRAGTRGRRDQRGRGAGRGAPCRSRAQGGESRGHRRRVWAARASRDAATSGPPDAREDRRRPRRGAHGGGPQRRGRGRARRARRGERRRRGLAGARGGVPRRDRAPARRPRPLPSSASTGRRRPPSSSSPSTTTSRPCCAPAGSRT